MRLVSFLAPALLLPLLAGPPTLAGESPDDCLEFADILYCPTSATTRLELGEGQIEVTAEPGHPARVSTVSTSPAAVWSATFHHEDEYPEGSLLELEIVGAIDKGDREPLVRIEASHNDGRLTLITDLEPLGAEAATVEYRFGGESLGSEELTADGLVGAGRLYTDVEMSGDSLVYRFAAGALALVDGATVDELRIRLSGQRNIDHFSGSSWSASPDRGGRLAHLTLVEIRCPGDRYDWLESFGGTELDGAKSVVTQIWGAGDWGQLGAYVASQVHPDHNAHYGTVTLSASQASFDDLVISQVDNCGSWNWARRGVVSGDSAEITDITLSPQGHPVAVGHFSGTVTFDEGDDPVDPGQNVLTTSDSEVFLVSYDRDGDLRWVRSYAPPGDARRANAVAVAADGTLYVVGDGDSDGFLAVFDADGQPVTDALIDGYTSVITRGVAVTVKGEICVAGSLRGGAYFDGLWRNAQVTADGFLAHYSLDNGSLSAVDVETLGGTGSVSFNAVAAGWNGISPPCDYWENGFPAPCPKRTPWEPGDFSWVKTYCAVVGDFDQQLTFQDPHGPGSDTLTASGRDVFVARYDHHFGSLVPPISAVQIGGPSDDHGADISIANRSGGPISVTGSFEGEITVGEWISGDTFTNSTTTLESLGHQVLGQSDRDIFTARYTSGLYLFSAGRAGGLDDDEGHGISSRGRRTDVFTVGDHDGSVNSDLWGRPPLDTSGHGDRDGLLGKNTPSGPP